MFIGHIGTGLALKRAAPRLNVGVPVAASLLPDFLLGIFTLLGWEQVVVPPDFARLHYFRFRFPFSHSAASAALLSLATYGIVSFFLRGRPWRGRGALAAGAAVVLHFAGDLVEHPPELTLAGNDSLRLGLGLWNDLGWALALEGLLAASGFLLYLTAAPGVRPWRIAVLAAVVLALAVPAIAGQALSDIPADPRTAAASWILVPLVLAPLCGWLDRGAGSVPAGAS